MKKVVDVIQIGDMYFLVSSRIIKYVMQWHCHDYLCDISTYLEDHPDPGTIIQFFNEEDAFTFKLRWL